jgi:hypothetical protein
VRGEEIRRIEEERCDEENLKLITLKYIERGSEGGR